jgi:hypothetical protein
VSPVPPRLARALVRRLVAPEVRALLLADPDDAFAATIRDRGLTAARLWYRWHVARSLPALLAARLAQVLPGLSGGSALLDDLWLALAVRWVARLPGLAAVASLTLAIGISAGTLLFGALDAVPGRRLGQ